MINYMDHIHRDTGICNGQPVIKGTRVTLKTVLCSVAEGATAQEIIEDFPSLKVEDVQAAIAFAAASASEDLPMAQVPSLK